MNTMNRMVHLNAHYWSQRQLFDACVDYPGRSTWAIRTQLSCVDRLNHALVAEYHMEQTNPIARKVKAHPVWAAYRQFVLTRKAGTPSPPTSYGEPHEILNEG